MGQAEGVGEYVSFQWVSTVPGVHFLGVEWRWHVKQAKTLVWNQMVL